MHEIASLQLTASNIGQSFTVGSDGAGGTMITGGGITPGATVHNGVFQMFGPSNYDYTSMFPALALAASASLADIGGGLPIPYREQDEPFDLDAWAASLDEVRAVHPDFELVIEPGRYMVAECGVLLAHATQVVEKDGIRRLGLDGKRRDGTIRDTVMYSMRAGEWPEAKAQLLYLLERHALA